jgi:hypothetical protein
MNGHPILIATMLLATPVLAAGNSFAASPPQVSSSAATIHVASPAVLKGSIANVQLGSDGNPEWIESGILVLRLRQSATGSDVPSAHLVARMAMIKTDGTAAHSHAISNFKLTNAAMEGNATHVFEGTATITMRDGPVSEVPLTIKIFNNAIIRMWIGPGKIDSHFGTNPVYGTLAESSRAVMAGISGGMAMNEERPGEAISNLNAAIEYVSSLPNVNSSRVASLGWCFG